MNAYTTFWGRDKKQLFDKLPSGTIYYEDNDGACTTNQPYHCIQMLCKDMFIVKDRCEHILETVAIVTLKLSNNELVTYEHSFGIGYPASGVHYMYEEGNYNCDCNRSLFLKRYADIDTEEFPCGDEIKLENLEVVFREVEWKVKE